MKNFYKYLTLLLFFPFISAFAQSASESESWVDYAAAEYDIISDITYSIANNKELKLDLYLPRERSRPLPVLMLTHGGGWVAGAKERNVMQLLPYLSMGWVVINAEYRLANNSPAPAAVEDCRCALRWIYNMRNVYNLDMNKIVLTGGSAGGHLALITGMLPPDTEFDRQCPVADSIRWGSNTAPEVKVAAIVSWYGIPDVAALVDGPDARHYAVEWFGSMENRVELAKKISPVNYVRKDGSPVISIHGDKDNVSPYKYVKGFHEALDAAGVPNKLVTIPGGMHAGYSKQAFVDAFKEIRKFLRENKILE
jgi:acetyl esterase/lipase